MYRTIQEKTAFVFLFALLGFAALQVPVAHVVGSRATFTLFDAVAPTAGAFLGTLPGIIAVALMGLCNIALHHTSLHDPATLIRLITPLAATLSFAHPRKSTLLIPFLAMIAFTLHPVGRSVWYFSLYWTIPILCFFFHERSLLARSFGATFTAHALGGALWIYTFNLPAPVWIGLIPVVAIERTFFALGMTLTFVVLTNVLYVLEKKRFPYLHVLHINRQYIWKRLEALTASQTTV